MPGETMHALRLHKRRGAAGLVLERAPIPSPGIGDVLVRVHAASFTPTELGWPSTWVDRAGRDRRPVVPGHEASGVVAAVGYGTTGFGVGDAVYGLTDWYRDGAAAEYVAVEARNLASKPGSIDHAAAAAVPLAALTAWQALFTHGRLEAGQTVLVHGAGGGVGTFAVQLAHHAGARVIGTGRGWARELVGELGADVYVDVEWESLQSAAGEVDLVLDLVGGTLLEESWSLVRRGGVVVSAVEQPSEGPSKDRDARGVFFVVEPDRPGLLELGRRIDEGQLRPILGEVLPLAGGRDAFERKQRGGLCGKTVLSVVPAG